ncbi:MAG: hypothetical protein U5K75_09555 [Ahrensia sp.]|nr:hypothetical protein [Ahrensia sp.]
MRGLFKFIAVFISLFLLPVAGSAAWWSTVERPSSWRNADWGASGLLTQFVDDRRKNALCHGGAHWRLQGCICRAHMDIDEARS